VRTPQEFAFEHIEGALLAPLATFQPRNLPGHTEKPLVFHCGSGLRSRRVAEACVAAGWTTVAHVEGGFAAWKAAKLPYVAIDVATGAQRRVDPANAEAAAPGRAGWARRSGADRSSAVAGQHHD